MKSSIFYLIFLLNYCYCEVLLGGWSTTTDESLKYDCLQRALVHITGAKIDNNIYSQASDLVCKNQIVNGLNIKCEFNFRGQKWQCSYYKSFIQTLETQLEQCKQIQEEEKDDEKVAQDLETSNEGDRNDQQAVPNEDEEAKEEGDGQQQQQKSSSVNQNENDQVEREALIPNPDEQEQDDEAQIDALNSKMSE